MKKKQLVDKVVDSVKKKVKEVKSIVHTEHESLAREWVKSLQDDSSQYDFFTNVTGIPSEELMEGQDTLTKKVVKVTTVEQLTEFLANK